MILLKKLHLENFISIESLDLDFEEDCTIAISGENGSGKSTLLYAVAFCLLNYRKGEHFSDYVRIGTDKAVLDLEAYLSGEPISYHIEITEKGNVSRTVIYHSETFINSDYTKFMKDHEFEYLESLMFMFQNNSSILDAKPSERAATLRRLFKFDFSNIVSKFKERQEQNKTTTVELTTLINELRSRTYETQEVLRPESPQKYQDRLIEVQRDLNQIGNIDETALENAEDKVIKLQTRLNTETRKRSMLENSVADVNSRISSVQKFLDANNSKEVQINVDKLSEQLESHRINYAAARASLEELNKSLSVYNYELRELVEQISISEKGVCHACGQPVSEDHVQKLRDRKAEVDNKVQELRKSISALNFDSSDLEGKRLEREINLAKDLLSQIASKSSEIESLKERQKELTVNLEDCVSSIGQYEKDKEEAQKEYEKLQELKPLIDQRTNLREEINSLTEKIDSLKEAKVLNAERAKRNQQILEQERERNTRVEELNLQYNKVKIDETSTKSCIEIFDSKFPNFIILQACEQLEDYVNENIQKVFPYCKVSLKLVRGGVNFVYTVNEESGKWLPVTMASGAQRAILSLAYQVALARLSGIQCVMLDEIDASMDPENAAMMYKIVSTLDCFDQVIFISHRKESLSMAKEMNENIVSYYVSNGDYSLVE